MSRTAPLRRLRASVNGVASDVSAIGREMVRIPAGIYMRVAEQVGALVLTVWLAVWSVLVVLWRALRRVLSVLEREVTPARAVLAVAALTAVLLAASQFADYRSVSIATDHYSGLEGVAPAPEAEGLRDRAGSAHAWVGIPLALAALAAIWGAAAGRWRLAALLAPIGGVVVAISLLIDMPKGLDEGDAVLAYEGVSANLLGAFWAQLACGALLIVLAPILAGVLRPRGRRGRSRRARGGPLSAVPAGESGP